MNYSHTIAIPAFNNHDLTEKNIMHLIDLGYDAQILLFDNGSEPSFEEMSVELGIRYHREDENCFVNPAWNIIFTLVKDDFLTLLNNDCFIISSNYFEDVISHMSRNDIGISSCKTKNVKRLSNGLLRCLDHDAEKITPLKYYKHARRQGWLMTINLTVYRTLDYLIPNYLKLWYGDDWIWGQFLKNNIKSVVYKNRYTVHVKNSTLSKREFSNIIRQDIENLEINGHWHKLISSKLYAKTRMFHRYA